MKKQMRNLILTVALSLFGASVHAMQVGPSYNMFTLKPGERATGQFTLVNTDGMDLRVTVESKDWFVLDVNKEFSAKSWLKPKTTSFSLKNGESRTIGFTVQAPKGAQGELVGMISFHLKEAVPQDLQKIMSAAVYVAIAGTEQLKGEVSALMVNLSTTSMHVGVQVLNQGNVHLRPSGYFKVTDEKGTVVANVFVPQARPTYPGNNGAYIGEVKGFTLAPGKYTANVILTDIDRKIEFVNTNKTFRVKKNRQVVLE